MALVKEKVVNKVHEQFPALGLKDVPLEQVRLREKVGDDKLTQVYHDQRELAKYSVFDGKEVAI